MKALNNDFSTKLKTKQQYLRRFAFSWSGEMGFERLALSSAEAPAGDPNKNSNNGKINSAGEGGKSGRLSSLYPLPIVHSALSFSFSPTSPRHKETSAEEREPLELGVNGDAGKVGSTNPATSPTFGDC